MEIKCSLVINEDPVECMADENLSLLRFLRERMGLMGTKNGCEKGHCGACTVIVNGRAQRSCLLKMGRLQGAVVETIENLSKNGSLHYAQQAFVEEGAIQCGFCTPGMVMSVKALLDQNDDPTDAEIDKALQFNICRCTGYGSIRRAVHRAVQLKKAPAASPVPFPGYVGEAVHKIDAVDKVRGNPVFADDYREPNMLVGKLLYSKYSHARILSVHSEQAKNAPGVALVLTGKDIPGRNAFGLFEAEQPVIAEAEVKYLGEVVAAVFAETREQAEYARSLIEVEYEPLPALLSPIEAFEPDAPKVHEWKENNVAHCVRVRKGDVEKAFEEADVVVEGYYYTPAIEHAYLEPEACLAYPTSEGGVTVMTGNQGSVEFQKMIAASLALPLEKVRVVYTPCGGGFGGKEEPTVQIHAALAAVMTGRPVKMALTREESIRLSTKRHPMHIWMKHGATKEGKITAVQSKVIADGGAYLSMTRPVIFRSAVICTGPYEVDNVKADSYGIYTHHNPSGAFRGFGSTQATFAAEVQMDKIARKLGIEPAELRRRNALAPGKQTCTGQVLHGGVGYLGTLESVAQRFASMKEEVLSTPRPPHKKVGFGLASAYKNVGIGTGLADGAGAIVEVLPTGRIIVKIGATDMGQGCDTVMAQIAATELNVSYELFEVIACDTAQCPDGGMTTASRQTYVTGNAVKQTAGLLREKLDRYIPVGHNEVTPGDLQNALVLAARDGETLRAESNYIPPKTYPHKTDANHIEGSIDEEFNIHYAFCFVSTGVAVEVDTQTGKTKVLKMLMSQDVGKAINPQNVIGQIEGAAAMGLGFGLSEEFLESETEILTDTMKKLHVPSILDVPEIDATFVEVQDPGGPFGAKGMGEVGLNPVAPAISNAIFDAVGARLQSLPMTKEKLLKALSEKEQIC